MDPNVTLAAMRAAAAAVMASGNPWDTSDAGQDLAEHVQALDGWLSGGGFLPQAWADQQIVSRALARGRLAPEHEAGARAAAARLTDDGGAR